MPPLKLNAVAFISPLNHPILVHTICNANEEAIKYHYIAHTSLDVIEERVAATGKSPECYLGLLFTMEEVSVYGYITPLKVKIVIALALADSVVREIEINMIFKALHMAYYSAISNPFLKLDTSGTSEDRLVGSTKWKKLKARVDEIASLLGASSS